MEGSDEEADEESEEGDPEFQADGDDSEEAGASSEDFRSAYVMPLLSCACSPHPCCHGAESVCKCRCTVYMASW